MTTVKPSSWREKAAVQPQGAPVAYRVIFNDGECSKWEDGAPQSQDLYDVRDGVIRGVERAYAEQPAPVAVAPEGWQMVPAAPTDDMIVAFSEAWYSKRQTIDDPDMLAAYHDMLVVAPKHPQNL